eukprot:gene8515-9388_t
MSDRDHVAADGSSCTLQVPTPVTATAATTAATATAAVDARDLSALTELVLSDLHSVFCAQLAFMAQVVIHCCAEALGRVDTVRLGQSRRCANPQCRATRRQGIACEQCLFCAQAFGLCLSFCHTPCAKTHWQWLLSAASSGEEVAVAAGGGGGGAGGGGVVVTHLQEKLRGLAVGLAASPRQHHPQAGGFLLTAAMARFCRELSVILLYEGAGGGGGGGGVVAESLSELEQVVREEVREGNPTGATPASRNLTLWIGKRLQADPTTFFLLFKEQLGFMMKLCTHFYHFRQTHFPLKRLPSSSSTTTTTSSSSSYPSCAYCARHCQTYCPSCQEVFGVIIPCCERCCRQHLDRGFTDSATDSSYTLLK